MNNRFNPHHTGDWLEFKQRNKQGFLKSVSILIILATGWNQVSEVSEAEYNGPY